MIEQKPLYIPTKVTDDDDFITGIGSKELVIIGAGGGIAVVVAIIVIIAGGGVIAGTMIPFIGLAILITCVRRDQYSESLIDKIKQALDYSKAQKTYKYEYYDFLEEMIKKMEKENDSK